MFLADVPTYKHFTRGRIAFEAQLSTTFLSVVAERRNFYRDEGDGLLIWILRHFDPNYRRMTTDDILYSNNSNVFVIDQETTDLSRMEGRLNLRCHFRTPKKDGSELTDHWEQKIVRFDELTIDLAKQQIFFYDYDHNAAALQASKQDDVMRAFMCGWPKYSSGHNNSTECRQLLDLLLARNLALPEYPDKSFVALFNAVLSAKDHKSVGWSYSSLLPLACHVVDNFPEHAFVFEQALQLFKADKIIESEDRNGTWAKRTAKIKAAIEARDYRYCPDQRTLPLLRTLFPPLAERAEHQRQSWLLF